MACRHHRRRARLPAASSGCSSEERLALQPWRALPARDARRSPLTCHSMRPPVSHARMPIGLCLDGRRDLRMLLLGATCGARLSLNEVHHRGARIASVPRPAPAGGAPAAEAQAAPGGISQADDDVAAEVAGPGAPAGGQAGEESEARAVERAAAARCRAAAGRGSALKIEASVALRLRGCTVSLAHQRRTPARHSVRRQPSRQ